MKTETEFRVNIQGTVKMSHNFGYCLVGNSDAVCFYIDPSHRASVEGSSKSSNGCPIVFLSDDTDGPLTEIEFVEYPGWQFHAGGHGKSIAIALVREQAIVP